VRRTWFARVRDVFFACVPIFVSGRLADTTAALVVAHWVAVVV
jgi:hypothetical protein